MIKKNAGNNATFAPKKVRPKGAWLLRRKRKNCSLPKNLKPKPRKRSGISSQTIPSCAFRRSPTTISSYVVFLPEMSFPHFLQVKNHGFCWASRAPSLPFSSSTKRAFVVTTGFEADSLSFTTKHPHFSARLKKKNTLQGGKAELFFVVGLPSCKLT